MHLKPRFLLAALGFALAPFTASAQDIELITEARVTFEITFGTSLTTTNDKAGAERVDTTRGYLSTITNREIAEALRTAGHIPDTASTNWDFVAVRPAPADVNYVDTDFYLYAVKTVGTTITERVRIPSSIFDVFINRSVRNYVETYQGRNVLTSRGTVINYASVAFTPTFTRTQVAPVTTTAPGGARTITTVTTSFTLSDLLSSGFSTIAYVTRRDPVFYYGIDSLRFTSKGDFIGTLQDRTTVRHFPPGSLTATNPNDPPTLSDPYFGSGLVSMIIRIGSARLVPRSLYDQVPFYD